MKTLDINKFKGFIKGDLHFNLRLLNNNYGSRFNIKYYKNIIPIKCYKLITTDRNRPIFYIEYYIKNRTTILKPFLLQFYLESDKDNRDNCYIVNIHKTHDLSGSQIMNFVLHLLKLISVKTVYIYDGTTVACGDIDMDLSLVKILTKGQGFYERFGFKYYLSNSKDPYKFRIFKNKDIETCLKVKISEFQNIKVKDIISVYLKILDLIFKIIKDDNYDNVTIGYFDNHSKDIIYQRNTDNKKVIEKLVMDIINILPILMENKSKYLYKIMNYYFNNECNKYLILINNLFYNSFYTIKYKNIEVIMKDKKLFEILQYIRKLSLYQDL